MYKVVGPQARLFISQNIYLKIKISHYLNLLNVLGGRAAGPLIHFTKYIFKNKNQSLLKLIKCVRWSGRRPAYSFHKIYI
jgi:hypothetical protein